MENQNEFCGRCNKEKLWTDVYEIDLENACIDCMTESEKGINSQK